MKLFTFFVLVTMVTSAASTYSQQTKFRLSLNGVTVREVFQQIEDNSEFILLYNEKQLDANRKVTVKADNEPVESILNQVFEGTPNSYKIYNRQIVILSPDMKTLPSIIKGEMEVEQQKPVIGTVTDEKGLPLPGVAIVAKGYTIGTITNFDGKYTLEVPAEAQVLIFSFVGMQTQEVAISNRNEINVALVPSLSEIGEVVVTALGIEQKKESLGYAVTNVSGEAFSTAKESNVVNSIAGKVAGVIVTPASSGMGGSSRVIIRGNTSIGGNNQPLYVVDGIPIDNSGFGSASSTATSVSSSRYDYGTGISDINPIDIESVSVLKGPNAAALYGSRAANGVILITTKKGGGGKGIGVTITSNVMVNTLNKSTMPDFQDEYGMGNNGILSNSSNDSYGAKMDGTEYTTLRGLTREYSPQPNNVSDFFRPGVVSTQSIGLNGVSEKSTVRFTYTNTAETGVIPNASLNRHNFNLRSTFNLSDKVSFDSKITYFTQQGKNRMIMGWNTGNVVSMLYRFHRNVALEDFKDYGDEATGSFNPNTASNGANPYWQQYKEVNEDFRRRLQGFVKATYKFNDWLSFYVKSGTDVLTERISEITPYGHWYYTKGERTDRSYYITETNTDCLLTFDKELNEKIRLSLYAGGNYMRATNLTTNLSGDEFLIPTKTFYDNLVNKYISYSEQNKNSIYSAYISGTVGYGEMIYLNFSGRNDWDSNMWTATGKKSDYSFFYPSVSLSFLGNKLLKINEEGFLSFSKLRMSWSEVGAGAYKNDDIYYYLGKTRGYNGTISLSRSTIFDDPNLKPETTRSTELGLELKFLRNRISADFTYYSSSTFDQIVDAPIAASTGYSYMRTNVGEVTNEGFELLIGGTPVQTDNFYWNASVNLARNNNVLESFIEGTDNYVFTTGDYVTVMAKVGGEYGDIYGHGFVYNNGKLVVDNNGLPVISPEEKLLGNYQAELTGGFSNTLRYKNLKLSALVDFRIGGEAYSYTEGDMNVYGVSKESLKYRDGGVVEGVVNTGTTDAPVYVNNTVSVSSKQYYSRLFSMAEPYVKDLTNFRLREITLGYDLPQSLIRNTFIQNASITLVGRNLFFFYKKIDSADPEAISSVTNSGQGLLYYNAPSNRSFGINLNISF